MLKWLGSHIWLQVGALTLAMLGDGTMPQAQAGCTLGHVGIASANLFSIEAGSSLLEGNTLGKLPLPDKRPCSGPGCSRSDPVAPVSTITISADAGEWVIMPPGMSCPSRTPSAWHGDNALTLADGDPLSIFHPPPPR